MYLEPTNEVLKLRLQATKEAQSRSRVAFFIVTYAAGAILAGLWNSYLSWERQWADHPQPPSWTDQQVLIQQIRLWTESQVVGISLLGLRVSVSDAAVLGCVALLVLAYYQCLCLRRENHEIGTLLRDTQNAPDEVRDLVLAGIRGAMIFTSTSTNDVAFDSLTKPVAVRHYPLLNRTAGVLIYLPAVIALIIVASDVYFAVWYRSPLRPHSPGPNWFKMEHTYQVQLVAMDLFALVTGAIILYFTHLSAMYDRATRTITREYLKGLPPAER